MNHSSINRQSDLTLLILALFRIESMEDAGAALLLFTISLYDEYS